MIYLIKDNKTKAQFEVTPFWFQRQSTMKGNEGRYEVLKEIDSDVRGTYEEKPKVKPQVVTPKPTITAKAVEPIVETPTVTVAPEPIVSTTVSNETSESTVSRNTRNTRN